MTCSRPSSWPRYRARDPHNVVHLTLNESEEEAGRLFRAWLDEGVLVQDDEPAVWAVAQEYVGPDGVARRRDGIVASLRVEPYEAGAILPHERTHAGPKESRLRLLRAAGAQLEPIFLLYDGPAIVPRPVGVADLEAEGTSLWRLPDIDIGGAFADKQLLIADGHHRYETALAYAAELGTPESARMMVVLVSTADPGLEIFPTHRLFRGHEDAIPASPGGSVTEALAGLVTATYDRARAVGYREGRGLPGSSVSPASSTSSSSSGSSATTGSGTRPTRPMPSRRSTTVPSTAPFCFARLGSRTSSSALGAAR